MSRWPLTGAGVAASLAATALWHGPLGAAGKFAAAIENSARAQLDHEEMTEVQAHLQRGPLTRRLLLSGPADEFQRGEIVRRMEALPGVHEARWNAGPVMLPLFVEAALMALASFACGMLLGYLIGLRRRARPW